MAPLPQGRQDGGDGGLSEAAAHAANASLDCFRGSDAAGVLDRLVGQLADPTVFLTASGDVADTAKLAAKALFDAAAGGAEEAVGLPAYALPELHVEGFDTEAIWLQLDMGLESGLKRAKRLMKRAEPVKSLLLSEALAVAGGEGSGEGSEDSEGGSGGDAEGEPASKRAVSGSVSEEADSDGSDDDGDDDADRHDGDDEEEDTEGQVSDGGEERAEGAADGSAKRIGSEDDSERMELKPGEDQFFRFSDMDQFLQDAEDEAARSEDEEDEVDGEQEEEDYEAMDEGVDDKLLLSEDEGQSGSEDEDGRGIAEGAKYADLFGAEREKGGKEKGDRSHATARHETLSSFERQQRKIMNKIQELEEQAVGEKQWEMRGEVSAKNRPLNSVLDAELDFETGVRGAAEVSEEVAESIDELIRKRCVEGRFDDVIRIAAPAPKKKKVVVELDDNKSSAGLGELYEKEFVRAATGGATEDKDDPLRQEAKQLFGELCGKLDALSHFHFTPKPVVEELEVRAEVPALAMEEALPTAVSTASLKAPEEAFKPSSGRDLKAGEELSQAERKAARAKRKRISKRKRSEKEEARRSRAVGAGGEAALVGRKSEAAVVAAKGPRKGARSEFVKSAGMFSKLQAQQDALKAGVSLEKKAPKEKSAAHFKL